MRSDSLVLLTLTATILMASATSSTAPEKAAIILFRMDKFLNITISPEVPGLAKKGSDFS
jgi:hypothetical protein